MANPPAPAQSTRPRRPRQGASVSGSRRGTSRASRRGEPTHLMRVAQKNPERRFWAAGDPTAGIPSEPTGLAPGVDCSHPEGAFWAARDRWNDENPDTDWPSIRGRGS